MTSVAPRRAFAAAVLAASCLACAGAAAVEGPATVTNPAIEKDRFGVTADGLPVDRYTLRNTRGMTVRLITFGATVTELWVPDRHGDRADVVLGFDDLALYERSRTYFGCTVGRVAFRIDEGRFTLDGRPHQLTINAAPHHLHGGTKGLSKVVWQAEPLESPAGPAVRFTCRSPDGDQGYPGTLDVAVVYTLTADDELRIEYRATADRPTPVSLTHHGYFNLAGAGSGHVLGHVLQLAASGRPVSDGRGMPTGAIEPVADTPFDFRRAKTIANDMQPGSQAADGFDTAFVVDRRGDGLMPVARLAEPGSGRVMEVLSTEPAVVLYTGNYLDGTLQGKGGVPYDKHAGLCLETANLPNSVNRPEFPSIILQPDATYTQTCVYRFAIEKP